MFRPPLALTLALALALCITTAHSRSAGILYEVWHAEAATSMAMVKEHGYPQHTVESVLRSPNLTLNDVYPPLPTPYKSIDIYNVQPALGFYCLSSKRTANDTLPDCPMRHQVAKSHAKMLVEAGFDYIAIDITNWPQINPATDVAVIRPLENLFDMWLELRAAGIATPSIVMWCTSPLASYSDGHDTTWNHLLQHFYNNATRASLIWTQEGTTQKTFMVPDNGSYNQTVSALIASNGGRQDIQVIKVWALFGRSTFAQGTWGFFAPCTDAKGGFTTSMVGVGDCNQYSSNNTKNQTIEISASGGYMLTQSALPFASTGHMRGLTLQRLFQKVLEQSAPNLFMSSFNEFIGGRQPAASTSNIAINMGLPNDAQRGNVWVDTYASEFSRDIEPTVEGGSIIWNVAKDCVQLYKAGQMCSDSNRERPCCSTKDKFVWNNVWSLIGTNTLFGKKRLLTTSASEKNTLVANGAWKEVCHSIAGPTVFCTNTTIQDGRDGPFMLYNAQDVVETSGQLKPVYRCYSKVTDTHWLSSRTSCNERTGGVAESVVGFAASARGGGTLRELFRCEGEDEWSHALDIGCLKKNGTTEISLGFVR